MSKAATLLLPTILHALWPFGIYQNDNFEVRYKTNLFATGPRNDRPADINTSLNLERETR